MNEPAKAPSPMQAWGTVFVLFLLSSVAWMDRSVISMVIGPIRHHFGIGDFQVSLLLGFAFAIFYIVMLIPIGWAADRYSRRLILYIGVTVWSLASAFSGVAGSYAQMFAARMLIGAGEGAVQPVAAPVIRQLFGRERMAGAMSFYSLGTSAGTAFGVIAAGYILVWAAARPVMLPWIGPVEPWQMVFIALGLPGVAIAFLAFLIADPVAPRVQRAASGSGLADYLRRNAGFWMVAVGFVLINIAVTGVITWTPEYLRRRFGLPPTGAGWSVGLVSLTAPLVFQAGIGLVVNRLTARGMIDAPLRVMRWLLIAALPLAFGLWLAPTPSTYVAALFLLMAVIFPSNPLGATTIQMIAPAGMGSRLAAVHLMLLGLVGIGLGSSTVGFLSQYVLGEGHLNGAMAIVAGTSCGAAALLLSAAMRPMRRMVAALDPPAAIDQSPPAPVVPTG